MDFLRVRGFPFHESVRRFVESHDLTFVVEQNRDAQLRTLLVAEAGAPPERMTSVLRYGGMPLAAGQVVEGIVGHVGLEVADEADARVPERRESA
jgi:2-oxoglutarate ferredoxin oxidoreductase subunit alpha